MPPLTGQLRASDLRPIRQHHNFRRRKVPDFHECRAVSVLHRNLLSNRMRAGVSASDSSLRGVRDHGQERCHPAKRISGSGWRVQVCIHHHIAAPRFVAMAVYNAQSLLVIQNSRPCDKLTGRRQGERETKVRHRSLILPARSAARGSPSALPFLIYDRLISEIADLWFRGRIDVFPPLSLEPKKREPSSCRSSAKSARLLTSSSQGA